MAKTGEDLGIKTRKEVIMLSAIILASSLTLGVNVASVHSAGGMNNFNPGVYVVTEAGYAGGAYHNSHSKASVWVGRKWETRRLHGISAAIVAGAITGYGKPSPLVSPSVAYRAGNVTYRLSYAPKHPTKRNASDALHLSVEF
jgi:hypothetical protein